MNKRAVPSEQVNAAFEMGKIETRVLIGDKTLKPSDLTGYLRNCETAEMMADNKVLKYIQDNNFLNNTPLKNRFSAYKSKYWKSDIKFTKL